MTVGHGNDCQGQKGKWEQPRAKMVGASKKTEQYKKEKENNKLMQKDFK